MKFVKMQGLGNDYIFVDGFHEPVPNDPAACARAISDRHFGVGGDGLVLMFPSDTADARMRIFNQDGSEAEMCGNAIRCMGKYLFESEICKKTLITIETLGGIKALNLQAESGKVTSVTVDMGIPEFPDGNARLRTEACGQSIAVTRVSLGNPHAVVMDYWPNDEVFVRIGPAMENHELFPGRTNVEFCQVISRDKAVVRVWERGSGPTLACGTGACAAFAALNRAGKLNDCAEIQLPGGSLTIEIKPDGHVYMTGTAELSFTGEWPHRA